MEITVASAINRRGEVVQQCRISHRLYELLPGECDRRTRYHPRVYRLLAQPRFTPKTWRR